MKKYILYTLVSTFIFTSCGVPQEDFEKLKQQLEECQYGAGKLLSKATTYFDRNEYENCKKEINTLLEKHPVST
jgi:predicted negative regulator of RcsB-dependent stress response